MRRLLLPALLVLAALVVQLTVVDRLPLPGGTGPDLVLLVVVALALSSGPLAGLLTGFGAGLALDIAPPADHLIGVYALVFCLVGYFCGLVAADLESTVLLPLAASAVGAAGGAALYAGVGILLGNPDVTGQSVRHVLPATILYDVLLSPFILYGVALASRLAARLSGAARNPRPGAGALAVPGAPAPGRSALPGSRTPRIRVAASRPRDGWIGGGGWLAASAELARSRRSTVRLHLGSKHHRGAVPGRAAGRAGASGGNGLARVRFGGGRRGDGVIGGRLLGGGFFAGLFNSGRATPASARRFSRTPVRFSRRPAWGLRGAGSGGPGGGPGGAAPRRGTFSTSSRRKPAASAATPRRGTFTAASAAAPRRSVPATGSPRRGAFSGGSSTRGTFGAGSPRRGAFSGPRRFRALRRTGYPGPIGALGRVRGGRSPAWRTRYNRNGG